MEADAKPKSRGWILYSIVVALLVYAVSIGPAVKLVDWIDPSPNGWPRTLAAIFYRPLETAAQFTHTSRLLERYALWFRKSP